jgi:hypothetical protein
MPPTTQYYAIVDYRGSMDNPAGIARRQTDDDGGFQDEALARDLSWKFTPVIVEWKRGKSTDDLIEISEDEARRIIERFQARWAQG